jgi:o-succinylbenzoate synthase
MTYRDLKFKFSAGTSRGFLQNKVCYFIHLIDDNGIEGIGECTIIKGLSYDDRPDYFSQICKVVNNPNYFIDNKFLLREYPSIVFGLEMAMLSIQNKKIGLFFESEFSKGEKNIPINGLIWMGSEAMMMQQVEQKIAEKYNCIKIKVGIDIEAEIKIIQSIRARFSIEELELRLDANGAFDYDSGLKWIDRISDLGIHSIEQPITSNDWKKYGDFCRNASIDIALDEQLIGLILDNFIYEMLDTIQPQYIILKPSIHGGFWKCDRIILMANKLNIKWWGTSALESNRGLEAIAQWIGAKDTKLHQGLGTGGLYENNFDTNLVLKNGWMSCMKSD